MKQFYILIRLLILCFTIWRAFTYKCDKSPTKLSEQSKPNDEKYFLEIEGKPDSYNPEDKYRVVIKVNVISFPTQKFRKFILELASKKNADEEDIVYQTGKLYIGSDGLSQFSDSCQYTLVEVNTQPKNEVEAYWTAPSSKSGCVTIRAIVIETKDKWYGDDPLADQGLLTKTLCETSDDNADLLPEVLDECKVCDEAKYEMAFQGNWIRNNHPKDFPEDVWSTRFSDLIGASHKKGSQFWEDGMAPSDGLKELASNGTTKLLESELMGKITNVHTIIKARGLAYPNITSSSYAIFRVDKENHLVSVVTKMIPSPDWIVGVSNMELCLSNSSWIQSKSFNLYPRDVGTDDALYYTDSPSPATAESVITLITSSDPKNSPFYDKTGEPMKPIATLHFRLVKTFTKECETEPETEDEDHSED